MISENGEIKKTFCSDAEINLVVSNHGRDLNANGIPSVHICGAKDDREPADSETKPREGDQTNPGGVGGGLLTMPVGLKNALKKGKL